MREARRQTGLTEEPRTHAFVADQLTCQHLDGNGPAQLVVGSQVDDGHATVTERPLDAIAPKRP